MFGLFKSKKPMVIDPFASNPHSKAGYDAVISHNWAEVDRLYGLQSASDRYEWISTIAEFVPLDIDLPEDLTTAPSLTMLGGIYVGLAKRARGDGVASTVSDEAIRKMFDAAQLAYSALSQASGLAPQDSVPIAIHLRAAVAAADSSGTVFDLVERLHKTSETTLFGPVNYMTHQLEKWMGSQEEMWRIVNHYTEAPPNPTWHALKAYALIEDWLWHVAFTDDEEKKKSYSDWRYSGELKKEINELDEAYWMGVNDFKGDIPESEKRFAHHEIAFLQYYLGDEKKATPHVEAIGTHVSITPWAYRMGPSNDLMKFWNKVRKRLDLEGFYEE